MTRGQQSLAAFGPSAVKLLATRHSRICVTEPNVEPLNITTSDNPLYELEDISLRLNLALKSIDSPVQKQLKVPLTLPTHCARSPAHT